MLKANKPKRQSSMSSEHLQYWLSLSQSPQLIIGWWSLAASRNHPPAACHWELFHVNMLLLLHHLACVLGVQACFRRSLRAQGYGNPSRFSDLHDTSWMNSLSQSVVSRPVFLHVLPLRSFHYLPLLITSLSTEYFASLPFFSSNFLKKLEMLHNLKTKNSAAFSYFT